MSKIQRARHFMVFPDYRFRAADIECDQLFGIVADLEQTKGPQDQACGFLCLLGKD
jgi:hypothetical protein